MVFTISILILAIMKDYFANESPEKGLGFWVTIGLMILFTLMGIGADYDQYIQHDYLHIPEWYFYIIFIVDLLIILAIILIIMYRKIGVYLFPLAVCANIIIHLYYLSLFSYNSVQNLFILFLALVVIIPKWKFFK